VYLLSRQLICQGILARGTVDPATVVATQGLDTLRISLDKSPCGSPGTADDHAVLAPASEREPRVDISSDPDVNAGDLSYGENAGPHALSVFQGEDLSYVERGRSVSDGVREYSWWAADRLEQVTGEDGAEVRNVFDAGGSRRLRRETPGA